MDHELMDFHFWDGDIESSSLSNTQNYTLFNTMNPQVDSAYNFNVDLASQLPLLPDQAALCVEGYEEDSEIDELEDDVSGDELILKELTETDDQQEDQELARQVRLQIARREITKARYALTETMLYCMKECNVKGFFYGVVKNNDTMYASSNSLRAWWVELVRFDRNGPAAIAEYRAANTGRPSSGVSYQSQSELSLRDLQDTTLSTLISALMPHCDPPQRKFPLVDGVLPPWWPTGQEAWWPLICISQFIPPPPYAKPHNLKKAFKVGVLMSIIKHMMPNIWQIKKLICKSKHLQNKMSTKDVKILRGLLDKELMLYKQLRPNVEITMPANASSTDGYLSEDYDFEFESDFLQSVATHPVVPNAAEYQSSRVPMIPYQSAPIPQIYTCVHPQCPYNQQQYAFRDLNSRNNHLYMCQYRDSAPSNLPVASSFMTSTTTQQLFGSPSFTQQLQWDPAPFNIEGMPRSAFSFELNNNTIFNSYQAGVTFEDLSPLQGFELGSRDNILQQANANTIMGAPQGFERGSSSNTIFQETNMTAQVYNGTGLAAPQMFSDQVANRVAEQRPPAANLGTEPTLLPGLPATDPSADFLNLLSEPPQKQDGNSWLF